MLADKFSSLVSTCYLPAGRSVLGKTVPKVEGTVFPNTDRPRPANNVFFFPTIICLEKKPRKNVTQKLCLYTRGFDFNVESDSIDEQE